MPAKCPKCEKPGQWQGHGSWERKRVLQCDGSSSPRSIHRFACAHCGKTVSEQPTDLLPRRKCSKELALLFIQTYLVQLKAYASVVWEWDVEKKIEQSIDPSTLWRMMKAAAELAKEKFAELQRKLIQSNVSLMDFCNPLKVVCPNGWKAHSAEKMFKLRWTAQLNELAKQFLHNPEDIILFDVSKWPLQAAIYTAPHKTQDALL